MASSTETILNMSGRSRRESKENHKGIYLRTGKEEICGWKSDIQTLSTFIGWWEGERSRIRCENRAGRALPFYDQDTDKTERSAATIPLPVLLWFSNYLAEDATHLSPEYTDTLHLPTQNGPKFEAESLGDIRGIVEGVQNGGMMGFRLPQETASISNWSVVHSVEWTFRILYWRREVNTAQKMKTKPKYLPYFGAKFVSALIFSICWHNYNA